MTPLLSITFMREYARRPINVVLLLVVPILFVALSAGVIVDFAEILGSLADIGSLEAATAGWAAGLLAGIAGFFQVTGSREGDRRLAAAGSGTLTVVIARVATGLALAAVAVIGSLAALWWRAGIDDWPRAVAVTAMFALIYLGIGIAIGAVVRDELNGSLIILFVWMFDMFLGPGFSGGDSPIIRVFPTHFPTLVILDLNSGHSTAAADLAYSVAWTIGALALAVWLLARTTRPLAPGRTRRWPAGLLDGVAGHLPFLRTSVVSPPSPAPDRDGSSVAQRTSSTGHRTDPPRRQSRRRAPSSPHQRGSARALTAFKYAFRQYRRNTVMWILLLGLPVAFITLSFAVTPEQPAPIQLVEGGVSTLSIVSMTQVHGAIMAPITVAFLAGIAGLFVVLSSAEADRRLVQAGFRTSEVLSARVGIIWGVALAVTAVSLAVTAASFTPESWPTFILANVLVALTYGMIGVVIGMLAGRLGGLYLIITIPFIDVGIAQNVMFDAAPPAWGRFLPSHGAVRLLVDGAFTPTFDEYGALLLAVGWLAAATAVALVVFHRLARPAS